MKRYTLAAATLTLALGAFAGQASATTVTFDFTQSMAAAGGTSSGNAMGNQFTFTSGGLTIKMRGYSLNDTAASTTFAAGAMGYYAGYGVGVCNASEGLNCSSPNHQIDNSVRYDLVLLQFSPVIQIASAVVQTYSNAGTSASYYIGNTATPLDLSGKAYGTLSSLGFGARSDDTNGASGVNTISAGTAGGSTFNSLLLAADLSQSTDAFKIKSLTITYSVPTPPVTAVPEPISIAFVGTGLLGLGLIRARKRA